jgi:hypothetical protein
MRQVLQIAIVLGFLSAPAAHRLRLRRSGLLALANLAGFHRNVATPTSKPWSAMTVIHACDRLAASRNRR